MKKREDNGNDDGGWGDDDLDFDVGGDDNNSSGTNGMHNNVPLTREHQMQLGEPKGKITEKSPKGYSKFQNKLWNYLNYSQNSPLQSIQNIIGQDNFSSWKNGMCSFVVGNSTK